MDVDNLDKVGFGGSIAPVPTRGFAQRFVSFGQTSEPLLMRRMSAPLAKEASR
jgi:hypothetical protein